LGTRSQIGEILIRRITTFPYQGKDLVDEFMSKNKDKEMAQMIKDNFGLVNKSHGYEINSIED